MIWTDMSWLPDNPTTLKKLIQELMQSDSILDQKLILLRYKYHSENSAPHLYEDDEIG